MCNDGINFVCVFCMFLVDFDVLISFLALVSVPLHACMANKTDMAHSEKQIGFSTKSVIKWQINKFSTIALNSAAMGFLVVCSLSTMIFFAVVSLSLATYNFTSWQVLYALCICVLCDGDTVLFSHSHSHTSAAKLLPSFWLILSLIENVVQRPIPKSMNKFI